MASPLTSFSMHGAREAIAGGLGHIAEQVEGIERAVVEKPGLAFDLAKTLVESICRAVLTERSVAFSEGDDLPKLFKAVTRSLSFLPAGAMAEGEIRKSLAQTLNGLHTTIQGICELRNQCGFASHGSGSPRPVMELAQALFAAEAADTIVGFLHRIHRQDRAPRSSIRARYDENPAFNAYVDDAYPVVRVFEVEFRASDVLFQMEPETYRVYLTEFGQEAVAESGGLSDGPSEATP